MKYGLILGLLMLALASTVQINQATHPQPVSAAAEQNLSGSVIFASNRTGSWNIFQMDLATKAVKNLTNNAADNLNPQLSPDKKTIVFYSNRDGNNQIYSLNLETSAVTRLTSNKANEYDPSFSPDGKKIVFKSNKEDGLGDIWIMNADGTGRKNMTPSLKLTEEWDPVFSPDGSRIYFTSGLQQFSEILMIYTTTGDRGGVYGLTHNTVPDWYPSVNPVTGEVLEVSRAQGASNDSIFVVSADGKSRKQLTTLPGDSDDASWSADGKQIVFINNHSGVYDLYLMNADGSQVRLLDESASSELSPIFSF